MSSLQKISMFFIGAFSLVLFSCEEKYSDDDFLFAPPVTYDQLVEEGWSYFQTGDFDTSIESFIMASERDATQPEVYLGLGWSYARNIELIKSISNFQKALSFAFFAPDNETQILAESLVGLALVSLASGNYNECIDYVGQALLLDPDFAFSKDASVNAQSLKLSQAESYYYLEEIQPCFNILHDLGANIDNVSDTTAFGVVSHTNNTLITGEMKVNVMENHQLISVTSAQVDNINYEIMAVNEGTNEFTASGNPIINSGDSITATYYFTIDYADFLNKLLQTIINF